MIHVYKQGGSWKKNGQSYTIKAINNTDLHKYLSDGWYRNLDDSIAIDSVSEEIPESGSKRESELRLLIKSLGGKPGGRSTIKTLEAQLKRLEEAQK